MTYAFDPQLAAALPRLPALDYTAVEATRELLRTARAARGAFELPPTLTLTSYLVPVADDDVSVHVFAPVGAVDAPALLWLHGGGFLIGDGLMDADFNAHLAAELSIVVASVDYRLAPEHSYPAQLNDAYAALDWLARCAVDLGVDRGRIAIGGQSAGAGLAAAVTLAARDRGGPRLVFQCLDIPATDDRRATPSMLAYDDTPYWTRDSSALSWAGYLGTTPIEDAPYAAVARADDLTGLPPAFVAVCQFDPLRDEGIDYAQRLAQAGVPTELHLYPGTFHGSAVVASADVSRRMRADLTAAVARGLAS
ncbi:MAG TPA: alpha/beta hydrolase [Pseudolysinimonas sp.]|nr:alpha/beta hydrolase [Pseudolysinimonas sp.]